MTRRQILSTLLYCGLAYTIYILKAAIFPFAMSFVLAYLFLPLVDNLERKKISRSLTSLIIVLMLFALFIIIFATLVPFVYNKLYTLSSSVPHYIVVLKDTVLPKIVKKFYYNDIKSMIDGMADSLQEISSSFLSSTAVMANRVLWKSSAKVLNIFSLFFISPLITFYLLRDWSKIKKHVFNLIPRQHKNNFETILSDVDRSISGYIRGQLNVCSFFTFFYSVLLFLAGLSLALPLGIMIGVLTFIPFVGFLLSFSVTLTFAFMQFGCTSRVLIVVSFFIIGQILDTNLITPKFIGEKIGLHPNWVVFGLFASVVAFGLVGSVMALPLTAATSVGVRFAIKEYKKSSIYKGGR